MTAPDGAAAADEPTPGQKAAAEFLQDLYDMANGTGKHAEHTQSQVGRCVHCSCGMRYQGELNRG